MAIRINNKEYLTYEEQVLKNKTDIEKINDKFVEMGKKGIYQDAVYCKTVGDDASGIKIKKLTGIGYSSLHFECELEEPSGGALMVSFYGDEGDSFSVNLLGNKVKIEFHDYNSAVNFNFILKVYVNDELALTSREYYYIMTRGSPLLLRNVKIW